MDLSGLPDVFFFFLQNFQKSFFREMISSLQCFQKTHYSSIFTAFLGISFQKTQNMKLFVFFFFFSFNAVPIKNKLRDYISFQDIFLIFVVKKSKGKNNRQAVIKTIEVEPKKAVDVSEVNTLDGEE
jgi:hypothetical protein